MSSPQYPSIDASRFIAKRSSCWKPAGIRSLFPLEHIPGMISLLAGKPNPATFPFDSISLKIRNPDPNAPSDTVEIAGADLDEALQYGATIGYSRLVEWLQKLQVISHGRPKDATWRLSMGSGSQDVLFKAFHAMIDEGDSVLVETPAFAGVLGFLHAEPCKLYEVHGDNYGLNPDNLEKVLSNWENDNPGKPFPRLLYTLPVGSNPTGTSIPESRKRRVLQLAKQYDIMIMEDDAYAYLYYGPADERAKSYFALEGEVNGEVGRVVRFDSFSKILSSGMRLGFVTGPPVICDIIDLIAANTHLQVPTTTQAMVYAVLSHWTHEGFIEHCARVATFYREKRDAFEIAAHKHLDGLAEWVTPVAGMFLWLKLFLTEDGSEGDSDELISNKAVKKGVLAVPGVSFIPSGSKSCYVRVSFSLATPEDADEAFRRLKEVILEARTEHPSA